MNRRGFFRLAVGAMLLSPLGAAAQPRKPSIGYLGAASRAQLAPEVNRFLLGLKGQGFIEGDNVVIEWRWARNDLGALQGLAAELVERRPDVIASTGGLPTLLALKSVGVTAPTIFSMGDDPVAVGVVANLARPTGNVSGSTFLSLGFGGKRLELLRDLLPSARSVAVIRDRTAPSSESEWREMLAAAASLNLSLTPYETNGDHDLSRVCESALREKPDALVPSGSVFLTSRRKIVLGAALEASTPVIGSMHLWTNDGALASYGGSVGESYQNAGDYTGRILKGAAPPELPVLLPKIFEPKVNARTARQLRVGIPESILVRADEVIE